MVQPWLLVTPASRGVGFQLARRLLKTTNLPVVATARSNQDETKGKLLDGLSGVDEKRLDVLELDVKDESTISAAASFCKDKFSSSYLHSAYCVPGVLTPEKSPAQIDYARALDMFQTNTLGPLMLLKHFSPLLPSKRTETLSADDARAARLPARATFALMAARVGSISDNRAGGWFSYRSSKTAVMQIAKTLNVYVDMASGGKAMALALHPGTVKTELSREFWGSTPEEKLFTPEFAAERLVEVVRGLERAQGGRCWDWNGEEIKP